MKYSYRALYHAFSCYRVLLARMACAMCVYVCMWLVSDVSWWRHQMEAFSALLAICAGNSPVTGEFPSQRPVTRSFDIFCDLRLNKRLSKQSWGWWFETPSRPLWCHCNDYDGAWYFMDGWIKNLLWKNNDVEFRCQEVCISNWKKNTPQFLRIQMGAGGQVKLYCHGHITLC